MPEPAAAAPISPAPVAPVMAPPMPAAMPPAAAPMAAPLADGAALAAFLRGAGMADARMDNPIATMEELGRAFRHIVSGLRAVLIARASIKGEFRIEQTMIRAKGNNPLKFSADDDDALNAFFGTGRRTSMGPADAVSEALRDITLHELAVVAAMQAATREVLKWLSPDEAMAGAQGGILPMQKKANAFDVYADTHQALLAALSDDFERVYGKAFARAYEDALRDARQKPEPR
jgi:type VI secretion system FHA domain protein